MRLRSIARFLIQVSPPLRRWWRRRRFSVAAWEQFYAKEHDPFGFDRNPYEAGKFAHLLKALDGRRYGRALEIGCSVGSFTEKLADVCDEVVGTDISQTAVDRTRQRLPGKSNVRIERLTFRLNNRRGRSISWSARTCSITSLITAPGDKALGGLGSPRRQPTGAALSRGRQWSDNGWEGP